MPEKPNKPANAEEQHELEFTPDLRFDDETILEADGEYVACIELMKKEPMPWCLRSNLTLVHPFGIAAMILQFHNDGNVDITACVPSTSDYISNFDLRCLLMWCMEKGWKTPQPLTGLVKDSIDFWKHMWQVNSVDSPYLEKKYGKRYGDNTNETTEPNT